MAPQRTGPRLAPRSGATRQLVIILHGFGADGRDLIEIGRAWQRWLPDAVFVAPDAPEPCLHGGAGRQWFPLTIRDQAERWRGVTHAGPGLDALIDEELAKAGLDESRLALVGFSQGTMMALHAGLRRRRPPAGILGYSGLLVTAEGATAETLKTEWRTAPPILLVHGDRDDVIPVDALFDSAETLAAADRPCQWHLSAGAGHEIDREGLRHGGLFLTRIFGLPYPQ